MYTNYDLLPPHWTPPQRRDLLHQESARLSPRVAEPAAKLRHDGLPER
jgi:hypothetical protein